MNYGKKSVSKKRNSLISRTAMMGKRAHVSLIRVLFVALITICVVIGCTGIGAFRGIIDNAPDANDIDISPLGYATFLYDGDGNQLRKLTAPSSNRLPVSIDQIPLDLQHAVGFHWQRLQTSHRRCSIPSWQPNEPLLHWSPEDIPV